jgi:hypothetical protein
MAKIRIFVYTCILFSIFSLLKACVSIFSEPFLGEGCWGDREEHPCCEPIADSLLGFNQLKWDTLQNLTLAWKESSLAGDGYVYMDSLVAGKKKIKTRILLLDNKESNLLFYFLNTNASLSSHFLKLRAYPKTLPEIAQMKGNFLFAWINQAQLCNYLGENRLFHYDTNYGIYENLTVICFPLE